MNKASSYLASGFVCFMLFLATAHASYAAVLKFDPTSVTATNGNTFEVDVVVDAGVDEISGTDAYILYDDTLVEPQSVTAGTYFPVVSNTIDTEKIYINGVVTDPNAPKTGSGSLATITFKMKADTSGTLQFYCDTSKNDTSKIVKNDVNATNVIECANLSLFSINGGTAPTSATTAPTAPTSAPAVTTVPATGGTTTTTGGTTTVVTTTLPASGIAEDMLKFSIPGLILLAIGVAIKKFV